MSVHPLLPPIVLRGALPLIAGLLAIALRLHAAPPHRAVPPDGPMNDTVEIRPILPYLFFDSASAGIPARYHRFVEPSQTAGFGDSALPGDILDQYRHLLDIIGFRMRRHPETKIEIVGCNSRQPERGETLDLSRQRGDAVFDYLTRIWQIDPARLKRLPPRDLPETPSNNRDPLGVTENRRVELRTNDWDLLRPILVRPRPVDWHHDPRRTYHYLRSSIITLILFTFNSTEPGAFNERILREYLYDDIRSNPVGSEDIRSGVGIEVMGHLDEIDPSEGNVRLAAGRVKSVARRIVSEIPRERYNAIETGVAAHASLHSNATPEGHFYNRSVTITVTQEMTIRPWR